MDVEILQSNLKKLRLSGIAKVLPIKLHEAEVGEIPYSQFLDNLITEEINKRRSNVSTKKLRDARFPALKTIDEFDFKFNQSIDRREVLELLTCRVVVEKRNVLFIGPPGVGKTHLAIAFGIAAIEKGYDVRYYSNYTILDDIAIAHATNTRSSFINKTVNIPVLIIDEFGMKNIPQIFSEDLIEILYKRYEVATTVICTNRPIQDWADILGDVPACTSVLDRLLERVKLFKISGSSYRLQTEKKDEK